MVIKSVGTWWKKASYSVKGFLIGLLLGCLNFIMFIFGILMGIRKENHPILSQIIFNDISNLPVDWGTSIVEKMGCHTSPCILQGALISIVIYGILGLLLGFLYNTLKDKVKGSSKDKL